MLCLRLYVLSVAALEIGRGMVVVVVVVEAEAVDRSNTFAPCNSRDYNPGH
jgi:hypothetical protein